MDGQRIVTVENLSACLSIVWGLICANPYHDLLSENPHLFSPMMGLAPEMFWGLLFALCGVIGLVLDYKGNRFACARLMFVLYTAWSILYLVGDPWQPGWAFYGTIAFANFLLQGVGRWKMQQ